ncbi:2-dehydro-3-deoxy-D-gluconate 5-dehydrogenase KduD [Luteimicrobium sp. DT211]|uniref:2-dehydro-3-deoxy-D-gluconate 5-dehydrogenase KduD n=1 Tax=Luteimicrobium sp. DT211 TaxID=3393412 RepID=UPI003CF5FFFF
MILDQFSLAGTVALVTGGSRGLGQAYAVALAEAGADVAVLGVSEPTETLARITALGRRALDVRCDLGAVAPEDLDAVVARVVAELGSLDVLVNNAGIIRRAPAVDVTPDDWRAVLQVNLDALFQLSQSAGRVMLTAGRGRIVNVASMLSFQGGVNVPAYTASKHAVAGLTQALANEWAGRGVNVNAVAPGYVATDNTAPLRADPDRERAIVERIPAGRWGTPDDVAGAVVFLASDAARYVHGTVLAVDGGWLAR